MDPSLQLYHSTPRPPHRITTPHPLAPPTSSPLQLFHYQGSKPKNGQERGDRLGPPGTYVGPRNARATRRRRNNPKALGQAGGQRRPRGRSGPEGRKDHRRDRPRITGTKMTRTTQKMPQPTRVTRTQKHAPKARAAQATQEATRTQKSAQENMRGRRQNCAEYDHQDAGVGTECEVAQPRSKTVRKLGRLEGRPNAAHETRGRERRKRLENAGRPRAHRNRPKGRGPKNAKGNQESMWRPEGRRERPQQRRPESKSQQRPPGDKTAETPEERDSRQCLVNEGDQESSAEGPVAQATQKPRSPENRHPPTEQAARTRAASV